MAEPNKQNNGTGKRCSHLQDAHDWADYVAGWVGQQCTCHALPACLCVCHRVPLRVQVLHSCGVRFVSNAQPCETCTSASLDDNGIVRGQTYVRVYYECACVPAHVCPRHSTYVHVYGAHVSIALCLLQLLYRP